MQKHLCIIIERSPPRKALAEYTVEALDWYYARHQAADLFRKEHNPPPELDWCVDSLQL